MIRLVTSEELAHDLGYSSANDAFRSWCTKLRITPVPGRRGVYDIALVRRRLDEAQGLEVQSNTISQEADLVAIRRARRATQ